MSEESKPAAPGLSQEFFIRVNDFIEMANRIERRYDTNHAEAAMTHAFGRYSAHHYRATAKADDAQDREAFADYIATAVRSLILTSIDELKGPTPPKKDSNDAAAE